MESVAVPDTSATGDWAVPSIVNCTVPVAVLGDTVAVKLTGWPTVDGPGEAIVVVVTIGVTICVSVLLELDVKLELPEYCAVIL